MELVTTVIEKGMLEKRDTVVLPILYNARHAIELILKFAVRRLGEIGTLSNSKRPDHDIQDYFELLERADLGDGGAPPTPPRPEAVCRKSVQDRQGRIRIALSHQARLSVEDVGSSSSSPKRVFLVGPILRVKWTGSFGSSGPDSRSPAILYN
jgi:hypothetical protein